MSNAEVDMAALDAAVAATVREVENKTERFTAVIALEVFRLWVQRAPVDKGRYRGSITVAKGSPDESTLGEGEHGPPSNPNLGDYRLGETIWINNSVEYAIVLELGSKNRSPRLIATSAVDEVEAWASSQGDL